MVQPSSFSLNLVPVHVRLINTAPGSTFQDVDAREPVRNTNQTPGSALPAAIISGQVSFSKFDDPRGNKTGRIDLTRGHFTMRQIDIDAFVTLGTLSREPVSGDIVTVLGKLTGKWFLDDITPAGHYWTYFKTVSL